MFTWSNISNPTNLHIVSIYRSIHHHSSSCHKYVASTLKRLTVLREIHSGTDIAISSGLPQAANGQFGFEEGPCEHHWPDSYYKYCTALGIPMGATSRMVGSWVLPIHRMTLTKSPLIGIRRHQQELRKTEINWKVPTTKTRHCS